jgi:hypothetical protein
MSDLISEVLAELRELIGTVDEAAMLALRAQADAQEAYSAYREAGTGSKRPDIARAQVDSRTAAEKAGKTARLLAEAASAFADYVNVIACGTVPPRHSAPDAAPTGEGLAAVAPSLRSRLQRYLAKAGVDADDSQEGLATTATSLAAGATSAKRVLRDQHGPFGTTTTTPRTPTEDTESKPGTKVGEATSALYFSVLAAAVAAKAVKTHLDKRHDKERDVDHEE